MSLNGKETRSGHRVRAFGYFIIAVVYFVFSEALAHAAGGFFPDPWPELAERTILLAMLLAGYGLMGRAFEGQSKPLAAMGLLRRPTWAQEIGRGAALGWGMLILAIVPVILTGGFIVSFWTAPQQLLMLGLDLLVLAVAAMAEEVVFRGYPFQRLIEAVGPTLATLIFSVLFGLAHLLNPGIGGTSIVVTMFCGWFLSIAYLRTRALWLPWGWHFAWNASMAILFGLPLSGLTRFSPVIQSDTIGPLWMTGGDYGPEASLTAAVVLLAGIFILIRVTREYAYRYAQPVIVPGGVPVDLDSMSGALAPHHPQSPSLVQIDGAQGPARPAPEPEATPPGGGSVEEEG